MRKYDAYFAETFGLQDHNLIKTMSNASVAERVKRGVRLMETGEQPHSVLFLVEGAVRGYVIDEDGQEMTDCFACNSGDVLIGCSGLGKASPITFETLTPCIVLRMPIEELNGLMVHHPEIVAAYSRALVDALQRHWEIKRALYQPAMERYKWFLRAYPGLIDTISNKHIASFLGITPVTLSRLRRQLRSEP